MMATRLAVLLLMVVASFTSGERMYAQEPSGAAADPDIATAPVELDGVVLFSVRGASALPAPARARLIRDRIEAVAADPTISVDSLRVVDSEGLIKVLAGDRMIMGIVEADASLEQLSRAELAGLVPTADPTGDCRPSCRALRRRPASCRHQHATRHASARRRFRGGRLALAPVGCPGHTAFAGAHPLGRYPVVRGDARRSDLVGATSRYCTGCAR